MRRRVTERDETATPAREDAGPAVHDAAVPPPTGAGVLTLQRTVGNAAVAGMLRQVAPAPPAPPPAAPPAPAATPATMKTEAEIDALTLDEFNTYAEGQADWATNPALGATAKNRFRRLLEFAREEHAGQRPVLSGCGGMTVSALTAGNLPAATRDALRAYGEAVAQTEDTVEVTQIDDVAEAIRYGRALLKLQRLPGGVVIKRIIKQEPGNEQLKQLIDAGAVDDFITYCRVCDPVLQAENGSEITSYLAMRGEGVNPASYKSRLPDVKNLHRFEKAALDGLIANRRDLSKTKPLALILHSSLDHNGAFHRDPNITAVITDAHNLTLMVEGVETLDQMGAEAHALARRYGQGGKIKQLMLAGHGNARVMEMGGGMDAAGNISEDNVDLDNNAAATNRFFASLLGDMASGPDARIVLNACLTASNAVPGPLDPDPAVAAGQVRAALDPSTGDPSLATTLQTAAAAQGLGTNVIGSNASFGQVSLIDASGNLDIISARDPALTASKAEYVRDGNEPQGCLRAVLEVWAADRLASPATTNALDAIRTRLARPDSTAWDQRIIRTMYGIVRDNPDNAELIRQMSEHAGGIGELKHDAECRVRHITDVPAGFEARIFGGVATSALWGSTPRIPLVVHQVWMDTDNAKRATFLANLAGFTCAGARRYVDLGHLAGHLPTLLASPSAAPPRGELTLALIGVANDLSAPDATCVAYLRGVVGSGSGFDPALGVDAILGGMADVGSVERAIGLGHGAPPPGPAPPGGPAAPPPNVDLDGDGTNDFYVEPMTRRGAVVARRLNVRERPGLAERVLAGLDRGDRVNLIGSSGDWYAVEWRVGTAFVHKDWVSLTPVL